ncbi:MAG: GNAT family N-acetyltransferase [Candidatus Aminicenantes bacterium]|nr:GNAT family N-acetyltransferase [Candidatus Aminicenantes bacterium]
MNMDIKIREYKPRDLNQVLQLVCELESELAEKFPDVLLKSGIENYRSRYLKRGNKYKMFVALSSKKVVGFLMGYPSLGAPEVDNMYDILPVTTHWTPAEFFLQITFVSKPFRNKGISKELHKTTLEYAKAQGFKEVYACIAKWNSPEIKVVKSFKFKMKDLGYRYRLTLKF